MAVADDEAGAGQIRARTAQRLVRADADDAGFDRIERIRNIRVRCAAARHKREHDLQQDWIQSAA
jgi:hypothetical protein